MMLVFIHSICACFGKEKSTFADNLRVNHMTWDVGEGVGNYKNIPFHLNQGGKSAHGQFMSQP